VNKAEDFKPALQYSTEELIKRLRLNIILHSCVYYQFDESIWSDFDFDSKCKQLVALLADQPNTYSDRFDKFFVDWDGESGFHFPHRDPWVYSKAEELIRLNKLYTTGEK